MSSTKKVRVVEALRIRKTRSDGKKELVFKVQTEKGQEPITMLYDQLREAYPIALIDFFEVQSGLFGKYEEPEESEPEDDKEVFDYDTYIKQNSSKILEHINSFTLSCRKFDAKGNMIDSYGQQRVYEETARNFYESMVKGADELQEIKKVNQKAMMGEKKIVKSQS